MSLLNSILTKLFGNKSDRDIKEVQPVLDKIKAFESQAIAFTNDQLRNHTAVLRNKIKESISPMETEIEELKLKIEDDNIDVDDRENMHDRIKTLN